MLTMKRVAVLALSVLAVSFGEARAFRRGPPTLCFPFDIDRAQSIPLEGERDRLQDSSLADAVQKALVASDGDDVIVRMETLRRAYFLAQSDSERRKVLDRLEDRVLDLALDDSNNGSRAYALAWFDLGYFRRVLDQGHENDKVQALPCIDKAIRIQPTDGGLRLGAMYVLFDHTARRADYYRAVAAAHEQAKDPQSRLGRNLARTLEQFSPELLEAGYSAIGAQALAKAARIER